MSPEGAVELESAGALSYSMSKYYKVSACGSILTSRFKFFCNAEQYTNLLPRHDAVVYSPLQSIIVAYDELFPFPIIQNREAVSFRDKVAALASFKDLMRSFEP
ncbi:hypothetical protein BOTNAR_0003g00190 [Botryotinia narcissicola]|uniref:Uncharacterized protein n=1 Tax=Botryotinia narcissicola TaxID=278944 RepID=A0A4Z1J940_9HELO|nr:hypothetical protein BOTNAR_0003g00190 [Botryotinia narcissicola]